MSGNAGGPKQAGALAPLRHRAFALLWTATLVSNIGTWMHDVSAAWLMTSLSPSPLIVAMVQAATTAAMALFALPAGAIADLFDRRRVLILVTVVKCLLALLLGLLTASGVVSAASLLLITFLLGVGSALMAPAWQAIVPTLVPGDLLKSAISLNSAGLNVARAIGPSIGGAIIAVSGVAVAFFLNAASEVVILAALLLWKPTGAPSERRLERFLPAIVSGLRYAAHAPLLRSVLWRALGFFAFAAAFWSLLPLLVRGVLQAQAPFYGVTVGAVGAGAVCGAFVLPRVDRRLGPNRLLAFGTIGMAGVLLTLAMLPHRGAVLLAAFGAGVMWIFVLTTLNVGAQRALPDWVRGRGLSIYGGVFFGAMTLGSLVWGGLATWFSVPVAMAAAGIGMIAVLPVLARIAVSEQGVDLAPAGHWPDPVVVTGIEPESAPVMILVDYRIDPMQRAEFLAAMDELAAARRRDGAYQWEIVQDTTDPASMTEVFFVGSWAEHERQHSRVTRHDAALQARVNAFHVGTGVPTVRHFIAARSGGKPVPA